MEELEIVSASLGGTFVDMPTGYQAASFVRLPSASDRFLVYANDNIASGAYLKFVELTECT